MTTPVRFYFRTTTGPTAGSRGDWDYDHATAARARSLTLDKAPSGHASWAIDIDETRADPHTLRGSAYVSVATFGTDIPMPPVGGSWVGHFTLMMQWRDIHAGDSFAAPRVRLAIITPTGVLRHEWGAFQGPTLTADATDWRALRITGPLSAAAPVAGDRLMVELGGLFRNAVTTYRRIGWRTQARSTDPDLTVGGESGTEVNPWLELTPLAPPDPPINLRRAGGSSTSLRVAWDKPVTGGPVDAYDVRVNGGSPLRGTARDRTITSLDPDTEYVVEVRSVNAAGVSAWVAVTLRTAARPPSRSHAPAPVEPDVVIDGHRLSLVMPYGDLDWVTCWPGGTESIELDVPRAHRLFRPGAIVTLDVGGTPVASGVLADPPARGGRLRAEGLFRAAEDFTALAPAPGYEPATGANQAVHEAIGRGMPWRRVSVEHWAGSQYDMAPVPGNRGMPHLDPDQPHSVAQYLDQAAIERGRSWGVNPRGYAVMRGWPTIPRLHTTPDIDGLAITRDGYASTLHARFTDAADSTVKTITRTDADAERRWGRVERTITKPLAEDKPISRADAEAILDGLLEAGRAQIGWTAPIEVEYGDVLTDRQAPVPLALINAGALLRVHGLASQATNLGGVTHADVRLARVRHTRHTATLEPVGLSSPMNDALAGVEA